MIIEKIQISNFRQFKDELTISFSTDAEKNVTIIMGDNGVGKTSFAQAFTWCLYEDVSFRDRIVLNRIVANEMSIGEKRKVKVTVELKYGNKSYIIERIKEFSKQFSGELRPSQSRLLVKEYELPAGWRNLTEEKSKEKIKEILPQELSTYFFFDGEKIEKMSKEITSKSKKSSTFSSAVNSLLGLGAISNALQHLDSKNKVGNFATVMKIYENSYKIEADNELSEVTNQIQQNEYLNQGTFRRISQLEKDILNWEFRKNELNDFLLNNPSSEGATKLKNEAERNKNELLYSKVSLEKSLLKDFQKDGFSFFSRYLIETVEELLEKNESIDKGIPDIRSTTLDFLLDRGKCICDNCLTKGTEGFRVIQNLKSWVPPESIGTLIKEFNKECQRHKKAPINFMSNVKSIMKEIVNKEKEITEKEEQIYLLQKEIGELNDISDKRDELKDIEESRKNTLIELGKEKSKQEELENNIKDLREKRTALSLVDSDNKQLEIKKAYVEYLYNRLKGIYKKTEKEMRDNLSREVKSIFEKLYHGGLSLQVLDDYSLNILVKDYQYENETVETSTAQSYCVILSFIAGVIKMARESRRKESEDLMQVEAYPLVMDAPLSAFDKTRIKAVCTELPEIAEQVIIFIKDTDGDLATEHLESKIGKKYLFNKINEYQTTVEVN